MVTLVLEFTDVTGATGVLGFAAALMLNSAESAPKPIKLRAVTLKVYTVFGVNELAVYCNVVTPVASTTYASPLNL